MPKPSKAVIERRSVTKRPGDIKKSPHVATPIPPKSPKGKVQVIKGDCIEEMSKMRSMSYPMTFADPPYNINQPYDGFSDTKHARDFYQFNNNWIAQMVRVTDSIICLHGNDVLAEQYLRIMSRYAAFKRIGWVIWHYRFGQCNQSNWIRSKEHLLIYARYKTWIWNRDDIVVASDRARQGDPRINDYEKGGTRPPLDVWGADVSTFGDSELLEGDGKFWGRIQGNSEERVPDRPNQLPELYLSRIIKAYTDKGDLILDPFAGTGTTAVVAQALGRNCVTIDVSESSVQAVQKRLKKGAIRV